VLDLVLSDPGHGVQLSAMLGAPCADFGTRDTTDLNVQPSSTSNPAGSLNRCCAAVHPDSIPVSRETTEGTEVKVPGAVTARKAAWHHLN
jgi:hypothetical protein